MTSHLSKARLAGLVRLDLSDGHLDPILCRALTSEVDCPGLRVHCSSRRCEASILIEYFGPSHPSEGQALHLDQPASSGLVQSADDGRNNGCEGRQDQNSAWDMFKLRHRLQVIENRSESAQTYLPRSGPRSSSEYLREPSGSGHIMGVKVE